MGRESIIVGVIGGVSSGKSTVAGFFKKLGTDVIDADKIVHNVLNIASIKNRLVKLFGKHIVSKRNHIIKAEVAKIAFGSKDKVAKLNKVIHPLVKDRINNTIATSRSRAIVIDAPLLLESGYATKCDKIVFVDASISKRIKRTILTRGWTEGELKKRESLQLPLNRKRKIADYVIDNSKSRSFTFKQVRCVYNDIIENTT